MEHIQPYDAVILDYKMPKIDGLEVGKEIIAVNPRQRLIFASAYLDDTLIEPIKGMKRDGEIEVLYKPFVQQTLVDKVEDKEIYSDLQKLNVDFDIDCIKAADFRHDQLKDMLQILKKGS